MPEDVPILPGPGERDHWLFAQKQLFSRLRGHSLVQAYIGAAQILNDNGGYVIIQPACSLTKRRAINLFCLPEGFRFADLGDLPDPR